MNYRILTQAISDTLASGDMQSLRTFVRDEHAADVAAFIATMEPVEAWKMLDLIPLGQRAEVFGYLEPDFQVELAQAVSRQKLAELVTEMPSDERADLFNTLSPEQQEALLPALAHAEREDLRRLAAHAEDTAGAIMTSDYAVLTPGITASQALEKLRHEAPDKETIYRAYVVDSERRLVGSVRLQSLILAAPSTPIEKVMERRTLEVNVDDDQEDVARKIADYDVIALPVVDADNRLVGIVTYDDAMDVLVEEATEDFHRIGAAGKMVTSLRDASIGTLYSKRVSWLVMLVFANLLSGAGIAYYEDTISAYVALVFFLPLLVASAGNAGSQATTLTVRAIATGEVVMRDWGLLLGREILVATLLGVTMALAVSLIGLVRGGPEIALVVALTMVIVVLVGSLIGVALPFALNRLGVDPATASAPLVTSLADAAGVMVYFAIATAILLPAA